MTPYWKDLKNMLVLAIDTSGDIASVTLANEDTLVAELTFRHKMDLLRRLMPNVDRLLQDANVEKRAIDGVVVSTGPGSFTGLRIGVASAKTIAYSLGKPLAGVRTLEVLACGVSSPTGLVVPMIHSRPGEVYASLFRAAANNTVERLSEDGALALDELFEQVEAAGEGTICFCGDGALRNKDKISARFPDAVIASVWHSYPRGHILASLGLRRLLAGDEDNPLSLAPHYVKRSTPEIRAEQAQAAKQS